MKPKQLKLAVNYLNAAFLGIQEISIIEGIFMVMYRSSDGEPQVAFKAVPEASDKQSFDLFMVQLMLQMIKNCPRIGNL